jgi:hypothetical protein
VYDEAQGTFQARDAGHGISQYFMRHPNFEAATCVRVDVTLGLKLVLKFVPGRSGSVKLTTESGNLVAESGVIILNN